MIEFHFMSQRDEDTAMGAIAGFCLLMVLLLIVGMLIFSSISPPAEYQKELERSRELNRQIQEMADTSRVLYGYVNRKALEVHYRSALVAAMLPVHLPGEVPGSFAGIGGVDSLTNP